MILGILHSQYLPLLTPPSHATGCHKNDDGLNWSIEALCQFNVTNECSMFSIFQNLKELIFLVHPNVTKENVGVVITEEHDDDGREGAVLAIDTVTNTADISNHSNTNVL